MYSASAPDAMPITSSTTTSACALAASPAASATARRGFRWIMNDRPEA